MLYIPRHLATWRPWMIKDSTTPQNRTTSSLTVVTFKHTGQDITHHGQQANISRDWATIFCR